MKTGRYKNQWTVKPTPELDAVPATADREMLPPRVCNLTRLFDTMEEHDLDGVVSYISMNVLYLSGFVSAGGHAYQDANGQAAVIISRHKPDHPIVAVQETQVAFFARQESWVKDIRPYGSLVRQLDLPTEDWSVSRFIPDVLRGSAWEQELLARHRDALPTAVNDALHELDLDKGARVGFDNPWLVGRVELGTSRAVDCYGLIKHVRACKTSEEVDALRSAAHLNREALDRTVHGWEQGMTWHDLGRLYQHKVVDLGGFSREPHPFAIANPGNGDSAYLTHAGHDADYELQPGMKIMFDTHGTLNSYCWDGGKTWVIGGDLDADARNIARAFGVAMDEINAAMVPGARLSDLQAAGRQALRKSGLRSADQALIFFHGVGLEHGDAELPVNYGALFYDWPVRRDMVVATHLYFPGNAFERYWFEDVAHVGDTGAVSIYGWDNEPLRG